MKTSSSSISRLWMLVALGFVIGDVSADSDHKPVEARFSKEGRHGGPGEEPRHRRKPGMHPGNFKALDTNKDGVLSFDEFSLSDRLKHLKIEQRRKIFDFLDRNQNGQIDQKERTPSERGFIEMLRKNFARADVNKDKKLDFDEFSKVPAAKDKKAEARSRMFQHLDRNKDGFITFGEVRWRNGDLRFYSMINVKQHDKDKSGGLNYKEYSQLPLMKRCPEERRKKLFERIDKDKNGEISQAEIKAAHERRKKEWESSKERPQRPKHKRTPAPAGALISGLS